MAIIALQEGHIIYIGWGRCAMNGGVAVCQGLLVAAFRQRASSSLPRTVPDLTRAAPASATCYCALGRWPSCMPLRSLLTHGTIHTVVKTAPGLESGYIHSYTRSVARPLALLFSRDPVPSWYQWWNWIACHALKVHFRRRYWLDCSGWLSRTWIIRTSIIRNRG